MDQGLLDQDYELLLKQSDPNNDGRALNLICFDKDKGKLYSISDNFKKPHSFIKSK